MSDYERKWWLLHICLIMIPTVDLQMPIPMYPMGPQIYALPPPPPIAVPYPVPFPVRVTEETTTTTTERSSANKNNKGCFVAIPAPYPVPVPVYPQPPMVPPPPPPLPQACVNRPRPKNCPQCPPCGPPPMPPPLPAPVYPFMPYSIIRPSVIVAPLSPPIISQFKRPSYKHKAPHRKVPHRRPSNCHSETSSSDSDSDYSDDSDYETSDSDSSSWSSDESSRSGRRKRRKVGHALKRPRSRRNVEDFHVKDNVLVRPVLSYISRDGDVKIKRKISKAAALELINGRRTLSSAGKTSNIRNSDNSEDMSREVMSGLTLKEQYPQDVSSKFKSVQLPLGDGKKEIVLRSPNNKKITNLTVSFQINSR